MPTVTYKTKASSRTKFHEDGSRHYVDFVSIPLLNIQHCNMDEFRIDPRFSNIANTDMFPGAVRMAVRKLVGSHIELDNIPDCVTIDNSGFLAEVTIIL